MGYLCFLIFVALFSFSAYGSDCAGQFIENAIRDIRHIQTDLKNSNKKRHFTALHKIRHIKPDDITINKWVVPFLQSEDTSVRLSAIRIITDSLDMYPQFISVLLIHLKHENSNLIKQFINDKISHITPLDRKIFYQGKDIVDSIEQLTAHFNKLNQWFIQLYALHLGDINKWLNEVLKKNTADRNRVEQKTFELYQETNILIEILKRALLNTPSTTYKEFLQFFRNYMEYSGRSIVIRKDINHWIQVFYLNFHEISSNDKRTLPKLTKKE